MILKKTKKNIDSIDLSGYSVVFCDSLQALEWAYENGLSSYAIIKTSEPAILWGRNPNIKNIEEKWTVEKLERFQSEIQKLTEDVFDAALNVCRVERELALAISQCVYQFQKIIYKTACLDKDDFTDKRLFIRVEGNVGPSGNMMNSPWERILDSNLLFSSVNYTLKKDTWSVSSAKNVPYWRRLKVAGYETIIYRLAIRLMKKLPLCMFRKEVLMPNENELNIEIASSLALRGVRISKIKAEGSTDIDNALSSVETSIVYRVILPIIYKRVENWVAPYAVKSTILLFESSLEEKIQQFKLLTARWRKAIKKNDKVKRIVLMNSPGNINGQALAYVCRKRGLSLISSQHGVTIEISKPHSMMSVAFDNTVSDVIFSYNSKISEIEKKTLFNKSKYHSVGMPMRILRMKNTTINTKTMVSMVYIVTHFYGKGFSTLKKTDYRLAIDEKNLVTKVLCKLPHKVSYKTYPVENRRNADDCPVLTDVGLCKNMEIYSSKVDMRYLISRYNVFITTCATSTLGWLVMSSKPVVFINQKNNHPLTDDAYESISAGIFVFNDTDENFHNNLRKFLSKPIKEIEMLWMEREVCRREMIKNYFSEYGSQTGAGLRAAKIILKEYLS